MSVGNYSNKQILSVQKQLLINNAKEYSKIYLQLHLGENKPTTLQCSKFQITQKIKIVDLLHPDIYHQDPTKLGINNLAKSPKVSKG